MAIEELIPEVPEVPEAPSKGLEAGSMGLLGGIMMGLSAAAPAYSIAATLGFVVVAVGVQSPIVMILAFVPMVCAAFAFKNLNSELSDCGTAFTWSRRVFGPYVSWMGGWCMALAGIVVMSTFIPLLGFYSFVLVGAPGIAQSGFWITVLGSALMILMVFVSWRGMHVAVGVEYVLVVLQYLGILVLAAAAMYFMFAGDAPEGSITPSLSWLNPFAIGDFATFFKALLLCVFLFGGWDAAMSANEETSDSASTPGKAVVGSTGLLLLGYLAIGIATISYSGIGTSGIGLGNPANGGIAVDNLATGVFGDAGGRVMAAIIVISICSSIPATLMPVTRGMLAMSVQGALSKSFRKIHPRFHTPGFGTWVALAMAEGICIVLSVISTEVLEQMTLSLGIFFSFYYTLTAFSCVRWFWGRTSGIGKTLTHVILPLFGGIILTVAFFYTVIDLIKSPGTTILGLDSVLVITGLLLAAGAVWMLIQRRREPLFFKMKLTPQHPAEAHNIHGSVPDL